MLKTMASSVYVSKGFNGPALKYSEKGDSVRFRIGSKVYDSRAEGNTRWVNLGVKAFGDVCARTLKMKLKEGSCINVSGRLDEERWKDRDTGAERSAFVLILDDIEYASSAKEGDGQAPQQGGQGQQGQYRQQNQQGQYQQQNQQGQYRQQAPQQNQQGQYRQQAPQQSRQQGAQAGTMPPGQMPQGFTGYQQYGGANLY